MKIAIAAWGTTGDVYPVLALAERLLRRKHHVRVCAPTIYKDKILGIGADFYEVGIAFDLAEFHQTMDTVMAMRDPSGLQLGSKWYQGPCVSCSAVPPRAGIRQMSPAIAKAIQPPSGDHVGLIGPVLTGGSM